MKKLLFAACLHNPEDFERWLVPYLQRQVEVYPFDYRTVQDPNKQLLDSVKLLDVDAVFVAKGEAFTPETISQLNEVGIQTGIWTIDDHAHPEYYTAPYSHIWTPTPKRIPTYQERGCRNVYELEFYVEPSAFALNPFGYSPDVSFLGTRYDGREDKITFLRNNGLDVKLFGDQWTIPNSGRLQWYLSCIALWHDTKVNLNIHQTSMRDLGALNTKMYEIPAAGGFMVTDYFPEVLQKFSSDEVALYNPEDDESLVKTVRQYLGDEKARLEVMERARKRIFSEHTAEKRAEQILREFQ